MNHRLPDKDVERFLRKVRRGEGCWEWQGNRATNGYGGFWFDGRNIGAHRFAYELFHGDIPDGADVCHACDNRGCVNPAHLWLGTRRQNLDDMREKGRAWHPSGETHGRSKLTEADVVAIRAMYGTGRVSQDGLARFFQVHRSTVADIVEHRYWAHVPDGRADDAGLAVPEI